MFVNNMHAECVRVCLYLLSILHVHGFLCVCVCICKYMHLCVLCVYNVCVYICIM